MNELENEYLEWMYRLVYDKKLYKGRSFKKLLNHLHSIDFYYINPMDFNRYDDGINLRYRFGFLRDYTDSYINKNLNIGECSLLEMMVALALRCEESIMSDPVLGDRTYEWFYMMLTNLNLENHYDSKFDLELVDSIIFRMLDRQYEQSGIGGLFYTKNRNNPFDFRKIEIWQQMCLQLSDEFVFNNGEW